MSTRIRSTASVLTVLLACAMSVAEPSYAIVDAGQIRCYDDRTEASIAMSGEAWTTWQIGWPAAWQSGVYLTRPDVNDETNRSTLEGARS